MHSGGCSASEIAAEIGDPWTKPSFVTLVLPELSPRVARLEAATGCQESYRRTAVAAWPIET
jgi:hypothetical protein